ncbi:MAG: N-acetylglucosamine kinase [Limnochordia bacterium]|jgi:N-acetylglucosamine kinase-like BadF-type ATPase
MTRESEQVYLGIDAGGTHTLAIAISGAGDVLGIGRGGAANHVSLGEVVARASIAEAVEEALQEQRLQPSAVAFGSSGLEEPGDLGTARRLLPESVWSLPIVFDSDAVMALEGALGGQAGIVVTAGTGAIAYGRDAAGRRAGASGWGWRIGDEGSAYWLGKEALRAVCKAEDGRGPLTALTTAVLSKLELPDCYAVRDWVYMEERAPSDIAQLAPAIEVAAALGDPTAKGLLEKAAEELAGAVEAVARRLGCLDWPKVRISFSGGVFRSDTLRRCFTDDIARRRIRAEVHEPVLAPVAGAALHAWRLGQAAKASSATLWGLEVPESVVAKLRSRMPGLGPGEKGAR